MRRKVFVHIWVSALIYLLAAGTCAGSVPSAISYQGKLTDLAGQPVTGSYNMTFKLFPTETGGSPLWTETQTGVPVSDGLFHVLLGSVNALEEADFAGNVWLETAVDGVALSPRVRIVSGPYAIHAQTSDTVPDGAITTAKLADGAVTDLKVSDVAWGKLTGVPTDLLTGTGTDNYLSRWNGAAALESSVVYQTDAGLVGIGTTSPTALLQASSNSATNAIFGYTTGGAGSSAGYFQTANAANSSAALYATTNGTGEAIYGYATGGGSAVKGIVPSGSGSGVYGETASASPFVNGVLGKVSNTSPGARATGVRGINLGTGAAGIGVWGSHAGTGWGVYGSVGGAGWGVYGDAPDNGRGVNGAAGALGYGVYGSSGDNGCGVYGQAGTNGYGVYGQATTGGVGVYGKAATSGFSTAVYGYGPPYGSGYAGYFWGDVVVSNTLYVDGWLYKPAGSFRIDHPLDPANKYLNHSFVESPDMMNIYNGNIVTDQEGNATVSLPDYFEALNRDFRYQLTVIGQFSQAIVSEKIKDNQFKIKTDKPNVEVSWQVTGIRQDRYANAHRLKVEEDKPESEHGKYMHPELYGQPASARADGLAAHAELPGTN